MTRNRLLLALAVALALCVPIAAQPVGAPQSITVVDSGTACVTAPTACATYALDSATGSLSISVSGTWTGTLTFEGSNANGVFTALLATNLATAAQATTTTANGLFTVTNAGVITVRVRATAAITGTATITAAKGLGFARAGSSTVALGGLATTSTDGMSVLNPTVATAGATVQLSPRFKWCGTAYNSVSTLSETDCMFAEVLPATAAGTTTQTWKLGSIIAGGAATYPLTVDSTGALTAGSTIFSAASMSIGAGNAYRFGAGAGAHVTGPANGIITIQNATETLGSEIKADALPTVASGFGTSPTITAGSTALAGSVNVGTGGTATSGVINFNGTAFPSAPFCTATPTTSNVVQRLATSTTQLTLTVTTAWTASDVIFWQCISSK